MRQVLAAQHSRRHEYPGTTWLDVEIDVMLGEINSDRSKRGLPSISRDVVVRHERMASGHTDYASKFGLYCAELAHGVSPNHKEIPLERQMLSDEELDGYLNGAWSRNCDEYRMACELQDLRRMKARLEEWAGQLDHSEEPSNVGHVIAAELRNRMRGGK